MKKLAIIAMTLSTLSLATYSLAAKPAEETEEDTPRLSAATLKGLALRSLGPAINSGRISDFAVTPGQRHRYFVATASGGVWRTDNAGTTWKPVFDEHGSYSIGCITMDPENSNVLWVGTGENNSQRSVSFGDGVYRSLDGGQSWTNMGLGESEHIGMIAIDPRDSRVVYVAAQGPLWRSGGDRGLYKTTNSGATWERILHISDDTGVNEVHLDPRDPDVVYASAYQRRRHVWTLINGGPESAIYKSTDAGETWRELEKGLPEVDMGRIGLAVSPADPDIIYAIVEAQRDKGGVFRSVDRGESWDKRSDYMSGSPQYYNELAADPKDVDTVYSMDTWLHVSTDGGKNFSKVGEKHKHVDNHAMWIDPDDTDYLLVGCDGGVYESFDRGATWSFRENLPVTQFYREPAGHPVLPCGGRHLIAVLLHLRRHPGQQHPRRPQPDPQSVRNLQRGLDHHRWWRRLRDGDRSHRPQHPLQPVAVRPPVALRPHEWRGRRHSAAGGARRARAPMELGLAPDHQSAFTHPAVLRVPARVSIR
jgi:photosystem II stability/assembly factor-like uncharacterized protein